MSVPFGKISAGFPFRRGAYIDEGHVIFKVRAHTDPGDEVRLTGSIDAFGKWDTDRALRLKTNKETYPEWASEPIRKSLVYSDPCASYKYVIVSSRARNCEISVRNVRTVDPTRLHAPGVTRVIHDGAFNQASPSTGDRPLSNTLCVLPDSECQPACGGSSSPAFGGDTSVPFALDALRSDISVEVEKIMADNGLSACVWESKVEKVKSVVIEEIKSEMWGKLKPSLLESLKEEVRKVSNGEQVVTEGALQKAVRSIWTCIDDLRNGTEVKQCQRELKALRDEFEDVRGLIRGQRREHTSLEDRCRQLEQDLSTIRHELTVTTLGEHCSTRGPCLSHEGRLAGGGGQGECGKTSAPSQGARVARRAAPDAGPDPSRAPEGEEAEPGRPHPESAHGDLARSFHDMAHIAQLEVQTRRSDRRFADARSSSAGATIRGKKCTHLAHSPGAVAQNATRANAAVDPLDLGRPTSHGNFGRHRPPSPRVFPQQSRCEANAMDVNRPSQPAEQGATDQNAPARPRQFTELGAAGSVDAEGSADRGIEGKLPGQCAGQADGAVGTVEATRPAGSADRGSADRRPASLPRRDAGQACRAAGTPEATRSEGPAARGTTGRRASSLAGKFAGQASGAVEAVDATRPETSADRHTSGIFPASTPGQFTAQASGAAGTDEATRPEGSGDRGIGGPRTTSLLGKFAGQVSGAAGAREATRPEGSADRGTAGRRSTSHPGQCAGQVEATRPDVFFADPEHPKDQPSWQLTVQAESEILKALKLRSSTEEKRTLIRRLPLMLHPDKGGTHEATTWFEEWKQTHLEWFMSQSGWQT